MSKNQNLGFTLIELLIVMVVLGVLATAILIAIDPLAQIRRGRDAQRKTDIAVIARALDEYAALHGGYYPTEVWCDSSRGSGDVSCPTAGSDWSNTSSIYRGLVSGGSLKRLPKDPVNDTTHYYYYEPLSSGQGPCGAGIPAPCAYWIGVRLEQPTNPTTPYFRCSDNTTLAAGIGCKEVTSWEN